jgi:hypothetical protein
MSSFATVSAVWAGPGENQGVASSPSSVTCSPRGRAAGLLLHLDDLFLMPSRWAISRGSTVKLALERSLLLQVEERVRCACVVPTFTMRQLFMM